MYDAIDMCQGIVNGTCVQETIYKKEQHRVYYTHRGILIDDLVSVIGQYDKEEEFMSYCIGRYYNEYAVKIYLISVQKLYNGSSDSSDIGILSPVNSVVRYAITVAAAIPAAISHAKLSYMTFSPSKGLT